MSYITRVVFLLFSGARSLWNLDLCVLLLPALSELIASKYDRFVMSAVCYVGRTEFDQQVAFALVLLSDTLMFVIVL